MKERVSFTTIGKLHIVAFKDEEHVFGSLSDAWHFIARHF
jgi:hypothetical protein